MRSTVHGRNGHLQIASVYGIGQEGPELTLCRDIFKLGGDCPGSVVFAHFHGHLFRTVIALFACLAGKSLNMGGFLQINDNPVRRLGVLVAPVGLRKYSDRHPDKPLSARCVPSLLLSALRTKRSGLPIRCGRATPYCWHPSIL